MAVPCSSPLHRPIASDVRCIVASNCDLKDLVREKHVRHDLYHRLNVVKPRMPAFRDPAHFIQQVKCNYKGTAVMTTDWGMGISKKTYLSFRFTGAKPGDLLTLSWVNNVPACWLDEGVQYLGVALAAPIFYAPRAALG